ncbi:MAG: hypothetical protein AAF401_01175 [Pseudomonadota bacterium]
MEIELKRPWIMRWLTIGAAIGIVVITAAFASDQIATAPIIALLACIFGGIVGFFAYAMLRTPANSIIFDGEVVRDDAGRILCRLEEIKEIDRGLALFKPSGGFLLILKQEADAAWSPGLWWRYGRRVGVGGATPSKVARAMADAITTAANNMNGAAEKPAKKARTSGRRRK